MRGKLITIETTAAMPHDKVGQLPCTISIGNSMICSDISKLLYEPLGEGNLRQF